MTGGEAGEDKGQEGSAQMEEGHASAAKTESKLAAPANQPQGGKKETRERRKPGQADSAHTLGKFILMKFALQVLHLTFISQKNK